MVHAEMGSSSANSFVTLDEAEAYFASRVGAEAWNAASAAMKERALVMAARGLERLRWPGRKCADLQGMSWPRCGVPWLTDTAVPLAIREAQCEEALAWLTPELVRRRMLRTAGVTRAGVGDVSETYRPVPDDMLLSPTARALVAGWVAHGGWIVEERLAEVGTWQRC